MHFHMVERIERERGVYLKFYINITWKKMDLIFAICCES